MKVVVDTDPGVDDTLALLYLSSIEDANIEAITVAPGNSSQENCLKNANYIAEIANINAPIFQGSENPLERNPEPAESHGKQGLGKKELDNSYIRSEGKAVDAIIDNADENTELLTLGPLTNLAKAIDRKPDLFKKYGSTTVMGGAINTYGNINRVSEFNFWFDPEAAGKALNSRGSKSLVPVNVCRNVKLRREFVQKLNSDLREILSTYINYYTDQKNSRAIMYDPLAAGLAVNPDLGSRDEMDLVVETEGEYTRGMTVPEKRPKRAEPNTRVFNHVDSNRFIHEFKTSIKSVQENIDRGK